MCIFFDLWFLPNKSDLEKLIYLLLALGPPIQYKFIYRQCLFIFLFSRMPLNERKYWYRSPIVPNSIYYLYYLCILKKKKIVVFGKMCHWALHIAYTCSSLPAVFRADMFLNVIRDRGLLRSPSATITQRPRIRLFTSWHTHVLYLYIA